MRIPAAVLAQYLLPQRLLCRLIYLIARARWRPLKNALIRWFIARYGVTLAEAELGRPDAFDSFNAFFTRALKPSSRPIDRAPNSVVSPVDGKLTGFGTIEHGTLLQAKGQHYELPALLGESDVAAFEGGLYATLYLAPHDYHRIHAPLTCSLQRTRYLPGARFSVNEATALAIPNLFCRNERVVLWLDGAPGRFALVLVGALNVSSISTTALGEIASGSPRLWVEQAPVAYSTGEELGRFNLGSTVVLILPPGMAEWSLALAPGMSVKMGARIGNLISPVDR